MTKKREVIVYSAGCRCCLDLIELVRSEACAGCDVQVRDMNDDRIAGEANQLGIRSVPTVTIDGRLADCCAGGGPSIDTLRSLGLGQAL